MLDHYTTPGESIEIRDNQTIYSLLTDRLARTGADTVIAAKKIGPGRWQNVTTGEFHERVVSAAKGLIALGIAKGDAVTIFSSTRLEWVMNTFVFFISRIIGWVVDRQILRNEDEGPGVGYYVTSLVLDICLGFLASMVVAYFSRWREYHADAGAADLMHDTTPMINALQRLGGMEPNELPGAVKGFGISGGIGSLFASHPSIEDRVQALRDHRYTAN